MSEMKDMLIEVIDKIFKDCADKETVDLLEEGKWAENLWELLAENEMLNFALLEEHGGVGGDLDCIFNVYRLVGRYAVPIPFVEHTLANFTLETSGLSPITERATILIDEEQMLELQEDRLSGLLHNVPWARHMQQLVTAAKQQDDYYIVQIPLENAAITKQINLAAEPRDSITFNNAAVIQKIVVPYELIQSLKKINTAANIAKMSGALEKANELTVQYSKERQQFGRPIHRFQLIQQHIAILAGETAITNTSVDNMISALAEGREEYEVALARLRIDDSSRIVATSAHQVHAAIGVTHEHNLHYYTRRLWSWREEGYTSYYWKKVLAQTLLQSEMDLWEFITKSNNVIQPIGGETNG
ncbi:acyl-CoA dehydrogenase [Lysinibacillus telephonicus]|uniref:acyl-CoA dehydrogenase n=1 Tax=Lysinibacillus telephonicus TaxID=1714840 RepID=UPI0031FC0195